MLVLDVVLYCSCFSITNSPSIVTEEPDAMTDPITPLVNQFKGMEQ